MNHRHVWVAALLAACGTTKPQPSDPSDATGTSVPTLDASASGDASGTTAVAEEETPIDEEAAQIVLKRGARKAQECPKVVPGAPTGEGTIEATFDGPSGRIVEVDLGSHFGSANEQAQGCFKNAFVGEIIPNFTGKKKLPFTLNVAEPPKAEEPKKSGKK